MSFKVPKIIAVIIFLAGLVNLASAFWAGSTGRVRLLTEILPLEIMHVSRTATIIAGFCLLFLADGISKQKKRAWWLSVILLMISIWLHLAKGFDFEEALILLVPLGFLSYYRQDFFVESGGQTTTDGLKRAGLILLILFGYAVLGFFALSGQFSQIVTWQNIAKDYVFSVFGVGNDTLIPLTHRAIWFENSLSVVGVATLILAFIAWLAPLWERGMANEAERELVKNLVKNYGSNFSDYLTLMNDKQYFISYTKQAFIGYKIKNNTAVILGGPIGPAAERQNCFKEFAAKMKSKGLALVVTNAKNPLAYRQLGWRSFKIGDEALINLENFNLDRPELKNVRNSVNKIIRDKITFKWLAFNEIPWEVMVKVEKLHQDWLGQRKGPKLTFSVDFYPLPIETEAWLLAAFDERGKLAAAYSWLPYKRNEARAYVLELMLKDRQAPNGIAEAMIGQAIEFFQKQQVGWLSLGMATKLFKKLDYFYGFSSLYNFKQKFDPIWEPCYLIYKGRGGLAKALLTVLQAHFG